MDGFLNNAKGKEVFQAYKYTKPRSVEKLPPIYPALTRREMTLKIKSGKL